MRDDEEIAAVVESWRRHFEASDADGLKGLWAQDHPRLTYLPTEAEKPLTTFAEISAYYDTPTAVLQVDRWRTWDVVVDVMTADAAFAWAFTSMAFRATAEGHPPGDHYWQGRVSFTLLKRGGAWKIVHYEDSTLMPYLVPIAQDLQRPIIDQGISLIETGQANASVALFRSLLDPIAFGRLTLANATPATAPSLH